MTDRCARYYFDADRRFVIEEYNWARPFSSFLPGIAGKWGIPMWVYYVNKAQGIASAGIENKDHAILEFLSFNKACQTVDREGFRTFLKVDGGRVYEPFHKVEDPGIVQRMIISAAELELLDRNQHLGLEVRIRYFPLTGMSVAGLVRQIQLRNLDTTPRSVELVDGVSRLLPYGTTFEHTKVVARHIEGMMGVFDADGIPIFRLKQTPADIAEVGKIEGGNYYLSWMAGKGLLREAIVVDPAVVFGLSENHDFPWRFAHCRAETLLGAPQIRENRTPCAFTVLDETLPPEETVQFWSVIGHTAADNMLSQLVEALGSGEWLEGKRLENQNTIDRIKSTMLTVSGVPLFDEYCHQTFLDNVIRGGMPVVFPNGPRRHVFYVYSRQNGDLERDYHWFELEPTYLSQGNGHYRNVAQNRRMNAWFFPHIERTDIKTFLNLIQLDGYNPLVLTGLTYVADDIDEVRRWLIELGLDEGETDSLLGLVAEQFTPGRFIMRLEQTGHELQQERMEVLGELLSMCTPSEIGALHAGYWIDHWFYNLDLIDAYLMVFPDYLPQLLLEDADYTFYDNPDVVQPRADKLVLVDGGVRQYGAVVRDERKAEMIEARSRDPHKVRTDFGRGQVYTTNLLVKLLCIVCNKIATLDPQGVGVEMEAGKPGWCDSLNGLPGLLGSSICPALELERLCRFLLHSLRRLDLSVSYSVPVFEELDTFIAGLREAIANRLASKGDGATLEFWKVTHRYKETYRAATKFGVSGREKSVPIEDIESFLQDCLSVLEMPHKASDAPRSPLRHPSGVPFTYFINEVLDYRFNGPDVMPGDPAAAESDQATVEPLEFHSTPVAPFLEGPVHYLRTGRKDAHDIVDSVKRSKLYDKNLRMYKSCESLESEPLEIGRIKAYARGWLENESIYTHMEYKWLLEILRSGMYDVFFEELQRTLMPFLDPAAYGRSPLENCSFIVSSAFPDRALHGQGFQPRLSGVTAEMINIWVIMVSGRRPFYLDEEDQLRLHLQPILPEWLFTTEARACRYWHLEDGWIHDRIPANCFAFTFMGNTLTVYHNEERRATFGTRQVRPETYKLTYRSGSRRRVLAKSLHTAVATDVRKGLVRRMDVYLG